MIAASAGPLAIVEAGQEAGLLSHSFVLVCLAVTLLVFASLRLYWMTANLVRGELQRQRAAEATARRETVSCAANLMRAQFANKLAVVVGYSEALAEDEDQPPVVRQRAYKVFASAMAAGDILHTLERRMTSSGRP